MTNEKKKEYTLRISQANQSGLLVILYEIYDEYMQEAIAASDDAAREEGLRKARACMNELLTSLDMSYEISANLRSLYFYVIRTMTKKDRESLEECRSIVAAIAESYRQLASDDHTPPLMENTQEVYAGLTYGRDDLSISATHDHNRGFLA